MEPVENKTLISLLKSRFESNMERHKGINWPDIENKLKSSPKNLLILNRMEGTGGEPDVIGYDKKSGKIKFCDCSPESPSGRRNLCYDRHALESRKANKPKGSAKEMAAFIGIEVLSEIEYRGLQELGEFDKKTSSWIETPPDIRELGGALFCDRRYDHVFVYHNGADSYYSGRGFRGILLI